MTDHSVLEGGCKQHEEGMTGESSALPIMTNHGSLEGKWGVKAASRLVAMGSFMDCRTDCDCFGEGWGVDELTL